MKRQREYRDWRLSDVEVRAADDEGNGLSFRGHAAVFDTWTDLGYMEERVAEGAFRKTLKDGADVRFVVNHDPNLLLARRGSGTLRLAEDDTGLLTEADMADVSYSRDAAELIRRGDMDQMSFAFIVVKDEWERGEDGRDRRTLKEVRLVDVSVVTFPAYPQTTATVRSADVDALAARLGDSDTAYRALSAIAGAVDPAVYVAAMHELREGRALSRENRDAVLAVIDSLRTISEPEQAEAGADEATTSTDATTRGMDLDVAQRRLKLMASRLDAA